MSGLEPWPLGGANVFVPIRDENSGRQHTNRLDEIKARAVLVAGNREGLEPTFPEIAAIIRLATFDVPPLIAAVEAVLEIHYPITYRRGRQRCALCSAGWATFDQVTYPCPTVAAIRDALGEDA